MSRPSRFEGTIGRTIADSEAWFDEPPHRGNDAPNVPTIYEMVGVTPPDTYHGVDQMPVTGHSFASVLSDPAAPATNTLQYFEMSGSRALVQETDGVAWKAVCKHIPGCRLRHRTVGALPAQRRLV